jgi:nitric oxide reductase NorQ protein
VHLQKRDDLFEDNATISIENRALTYLRGGIPVHLSGPAGTGKTTLAFQIAAKMGRPAVIITGDACMKATDLIGKETGTKSKQIVDRYIQSVRKTESETSVIWSDGVLATAMIHGYTLVYDEFSRSPPEANNALLMALEERMLTLTHTDRKSTYVHAHPDFCAIFTSNPEEYAGVQGVQNALLDRMITLNLDGHDVGTEAGIVAMRTGVDSNRALIIVKIVRALRADFNLSNMPSVRAAIMIGRVVANSGIELSAADPAFIQLCMDVFLSKATADMPIAEFRSQFIKRLHKTVLATADTGALKTAPDKPAPDKTAKLEKAA